MPKNLILDLILTCFGLNLVSKNVFCEFYLSQMLYIVASYHCMQFQGKLINQKWENGKKPSFRPDFGHSGPNMGPKLFYLY